MPSDSGSISTGSKPDAHVLVIGRGALICVVLERAQGEHKIGGVNTCSRERGTGGPTLGLPPDAGEVAAFMSAVYSGFWAITLHWAPLCEVLLP